MVELFKSRPEQKNHGYRLENKPSLLACEKLCQTNMIDLKNGSLVHLFFVQKLNEFLVRNVNFVVSLPFAFLLPQHRNKKADLI